MKIATALPLAALLGLTAQGIAAQEPATEQEKTTYAIGYLLGEALVPFRLDEKELAMVVAGLRANVLGQEPAVDPQAYQAKVQALRDERVQAMVEDEKQESAAFLKQAAAEPGAQTTDSGLIYRELQAGGGASPAASDTVRVHYRGTLRDGTTFDSSYDRGQPASFPLNGVIACWTEGLQKMKVGGKAKLTCPSEIAYGDRGIPPRIPGGAVLTFEVELLEIADSASE